MAVCFLLVTWFCRSDVFGSVGQLLGAVFFLGLFPLLAYPLQRLFPRFRSRGRAGQRILAMLFALAGYLLGMAYSLIFGAAQGVWVIYLAYFCSGLGIFLLNRLFGKKASGHACGVIGPTALFAYFGLYAAAAAGLGIAVLTCCASVRTGRHTVPQLIAGCLVPCVVMTAVWLITRG